MFRKVLVANRGEIALRVARACRELGVPVVAVYSTADVDSPVVHFADESVHIGAAPPEDSYLNIPNIIEAARMRGADAIHPGYGFLSEDPDFAEICAKDGLTFIGPEADVIQQLGDKATARALMTRAGLPLLPGTVEPLPTVADAAAAAASIGYPVILKAVAGGGGRGMAVVRDPADLAEIYRATRASARSVFRNSAVYVERFLEGARHVEVQVLCDRYGNGVHLGERDCSVQRRHQKLVEETPSGRLTPRQRAEIGSLALHGALSVGYTGAGTVECLLDTDGHYYFMEINARIQVEHPVTEMVTGIDLVRQQILVAAGERLPFTQSEVAFNGVSVECRINAEDPERGFTPTPGVLEVFSVPAGPWVRVDSGYSEGNRVTPFYDSLLAKIIAWAPDRQQALDRLLRALGELRVEGKGLATTAELHREILRHPVFRADEHSTRFLEQHLAARRRPAVPGHRAARQGGTTTRNDDDQTPENSRLLTADQG
jgi:acetyl-CoA carboxylase biotin carboxylase subunit